MENSQQLTGLEMILFCFEVFARFSFFCNFYKANYFQDKPFLAFNLFVRASPPTLSVHFNKVVSLFW